MQRSPYFASNIINQYGGKSEDIQEEVLALGCPFCGHINPDHRWVAPFSCLITGCECTSVTEACEQEDELATRAAIYEVLTA